MRLNLPLSLCAIVTIAGALVGSGCGLEPAPEAHAPASRTVAIAPRVVMDGLKELAAREDGRVQIDEVVFHAGKATLDGDDLLPDDDDDLIFRYSVGTLDDFGDVLGGVREWRIGADDDHLTFTFDPLQPRRQTDVELATGVPLDQLSGNTAFVHGTVEVMSAGEVSGFAACGENGESDPDTSPAEGDAPSKSGAEDEGEGERAHRMSSRLDPRRIVTRRVPFDLVITSQFTLERDVSELDLPSIADDQLVPLDLHIRMDELFTEQRVDLLDKSARGGSASVVLEVSGAGTISLDTSNIERKVDVGRHGIRVVSDPRGR
jgi:hypothetical protein